MRDAATGNVLSSTVDDRVDGTINAHVDDVIRVSQLVV